MVKFFLRNQKTLPKAQLKQLKEEKKVKKVVDFRVIIFQKMHKLIKSQHAMMIQKVIRKIKDKRQKNEDDKYKQQLEKLDQVFKKVKQIKKQQIKEVTLYIMQEVLKVTNLTRVNENNHLKLYENLLEGDNLKNKIQKSEKIRNFIERLSAQKLYQSQLEKCAQLVDVVNGKKTIRKQKIKERKQRRKQKGKEEASSNKDQVQDQNQEQSQNIIAQEASSKQISNKEKIQVTVEIKKEKKKVKKQEAIVEQKVDQKKPTNNFWQKQKEKQRQNQNINTNQSAQKQIKQAPYSSLSKHQRLRKDIQKSKPINKQRTQFKKTGRNKALHQKKHQKDRFKNNREERPQRKDFNKTFDRNKSGRSDQRPSKNNQINGEKPWQKVEKFSKPSSFSNPRPSFSNEQPKQVIGHPSWKAKKDQKQQMYIKPFEGKKIML